jgi:hypothetical protein
MKDHFREAANPEARRSQQYQDKLADDIDYEDELEARFWTVSKQLVGL